MPWARQLGYERPARRVRQTSAKRRVAEVFANVLGVRRGRGRGRLLRSRRRLSARGGRRWNRSSARSGSRFHLMSCSRAERCGRSPTTPRRRIRTKRGRSFSTGSPPGRRSSCCPGFISTGSSPGVWRVDARPTACLLAARWERSIRRAEFISVEDLARDYVAIIRRQQPQGPYRLLGYSFAGHRCVRSGPAASRRRRGGSLPGARGRGPPRVDSGLQVPALPARAPPVMRLRARHRCLRRATIAREAQARPTRVHAVPRGQEARVRWRSGETPSIATPPRSTCRGSVRSPAT